MQTLLLAAVVVFSTLPRISFCAPSDWQEYAVREHGFSVALPSKPQTRLIPVPSQDGPLRVYEAFEPQRKLTKFSVFVSTPEQRGIYEAASMDAFLGAHIASMVQAAEHGKLVSSRRITFRGQHALEYEFNHQIESVPYVGRGITFMVDGGYIRLSMWHPASDPEAMAEYERFKGSFELKPIAFRPANVPFRSERGVTFSPPSGWVQKPVQNAVQIAKYSNLTRSLLVLFADNPAYTCDNFRADLQASGRVKEASQVVLAKRPFLKLVSFEDVPKYNVRLTTVQYCLNSHGGAVVIGGSEEEAMFWRWSEVLEGAAATLHVQ
jgi:hypothetical protein